MVMRPYHLLDFLRYHIREVFSVVLHIRSLRGVAMQVISGLVLHPAGTEKRIQSNQSDKRLFPPGIRRTYILPDGVIEVLDVTVVVAEEGVETPARRGVILRVVSDVPFPNQSCGVTEVPEVFRKQVSTQWDSRPLSSQKWKALHP